MTTFFMILGGEDKTKKIRGPLEREVILYKGAVSCKFEPLNRRDATQNTGLNALRLVLNPLVFYNLYITHR